MHNIIYKCSSFVYKNSNRSLACRFVHFISGVKYKHLKRTLLSIRSSLLEPITKQQFMPVRAIYYLENEDEIEYKRFPSPLEVAQNNIKDVCLGVNPSSPESWDNVKMELMSSCFILTVENFDSIVMQVLLEQGKLELAQSFMDYLKERKLKPNFVTLCKYMVLCSQNANIVGQDVILETYEKIISSLNTSVLDARMVQFLVQGLCATDKWRKSFDYTNKLHRHQLTTDMSNALSCAALRNKDYNVAWNILNKWYKPGFPPGSEVFEEYMKFIIDLDQKDHTKARHHFARLADYLQSRNIILKQKAVVYVEEYFKRSQKYFTAFAKVDRGGVCSVCKNKLEPCELTEEEFSRLKNSFLECSVKKTDIFINTTAYEFEKYCRFIEKFKPFDIVLDGLNVAHTASKDKRKKKLATHLFNIVNHLSQSHNRILVLGRHHMKDWPHQIMRAINQICYVFYVSNISQDDPFVIYAALASGPKTLLISLDMMRDHISRLSDPRLIHLFKKWQQSHQVYLVDGKSQDECVLMGPLKHNIAIQGNMEMGWHVPFDNEMKLEPYEELNNWLCVQRLNKAY